MNRESYNEAKVILEKITRALGQDNLSEEEIQNLELSKRQLQAQLLSIWWPFDWMRRSIMIILLLVGSYGLFDGSAHFLWAWLVLVLFSPRLVGEISMFTGKVREFLR